MVLPTNLTLRVKPVVLVDNDESTFNAIDRQLKIWIKDDHVSLKKKSHGKGIMVSDFLTLRGRLRVCEDEHLNPGLEYGT